VLVEIRAEGEGEVTKPSRLPWKWFDPRTDLPIWLRSGIGQVVAEWAVVERELEEIIQLLLDVEIALSRIAVHSMQVRNRVDVIDLLIEWHVYNDKVPCVDGSVLARVFFTFCSIGRCSHVFGL
jgi:hypothetical protein